MSQDPFQALYSGIGGALLLDLTTIESIYPTVCVFVRLGVQAAWILVRHFAGGLWLGDYCQGPRMMIDVFDFSGSLPVHCICMHDLD